VISIVPDFVQIVMFAGNAQTLLAIDRAVVRTRSLTQKHVFELIHSGVREQQGRVVSGNDGIAGNDRVLLLLEEVHEFVSYLDGRFQDCRRNGSC